MADNFNLASLLQGNGQSTPNLTNLVSYLRQVRPDLNLSAGSPNDQGANDYQGGNMGDYPANGGRPLRFLQGQSNQNTGGLLNYLSQIRPSLNVNAGSFNDNRGTTGYQGNANIGADFPVNGGNLNLNADVSGYKGKWRDNGESGKFSGANVDRVSAEYQKFKDTFGIDFDPNDPMHNFMLRYKMDL